MNMKGKTLYKSLYLPINRKDDYQCLHHSISLSTPCEQHEK